ncbi:hypothetical protein MKX67_08825 [Cytobacillus sp. FSL W7-1323]|uniref:hypothetical protein n=1 Tax=Cytobacillus sp. FSL W7-1323 TaxID=2921700 RepID=UPI0031596AF1
MQDIIIRRARKYEAEKAIQDHVKRGCKIIFPLTEFSKQGKTFDRDSYNRHVFAGHNYSSVWMAKLRRVEG